MADPDPTTEESRDEIARVVGHRRDVLLMGRRAPVGYRAYHLTSAADCKRAQRRLELELWRAKNLKRAQAECERINQLIAADSLAGGR